MSKTFHQYLTHITADELPPAVMGIVNLTPDSFSGDGLYGQDKEGDLNTILAACDQMVADGATILDLGAESTRPGSTPITAEEEQQRLLPVIEALKERYHGVWLSVDSYHAQTIKCALAAGADIANDINGGSDPDLLTYAKHENAPLILMHNGTKHNALDTSLQGIISYAGASANPDFMAQMMDELEAMITNAHKHEIEPHQLIIDPGLGFGKTVDQNMRIIRNLDQLKRLGLPILIGASRKSFIGKRTNQSVANQRKDGSVAIQLFAARQGAHIIRTHDVRAATDSLLLDYQLRNMIDEPVWIMVALGSNLGNSVEQLQTAIQWLHGFMDSITMSSIFHSKPKYEENQPDFYNQVAIGITSLSPQAVLAHLKQLEAKAGRRKTYRNGPRELDLDLIFYGDEVSPDEVLSLPHPRYHERAFVLGPAQEIAGDWVCPIKNQRLDALYDALPLSEQETIQPLQTP